MSQFIIQKLNSKDSQPAELKIEQELLGALAQTNIQTANSAIILAIKDNEDTICGGLTASTSYGWLLIKTLWVADNLRDQGYGSKLVAMAEEEGRLVDCHNAWLDTSSEPAHKFYEKLGYEDFGVLENAPDQEPFLHRRWFMRKML